MRAHVFYRTVEVDGLSIFYREAGPKDAPAILCFTDCRLPRECMSRCFRGLPIATTLSRRLPRLWTQRLAGPDTIRLDVRSLR